MTRLRLPLIIALVIWTLCAHAAPCRAQQAQPGAPKSFDKKLPVSAPKQSQSKTDASMESPKSGVSVVQTVLGLAFVLCLILIIAAWAKNHLPNAGRTLPSEAVRLLGQRVVGQGQTIQLIRCGSRILIVGATPQNLTTLCEVTDPVEIDYLAGLCQQDQPNSVTSAFTQLFNNYRETKEESRETSAFQQTMRRQSALASAMPDPSESTPPEPNPIGGSPSAEHSLKERLGRLSASAEPPRFTSPDEEVDRHA